MMTQILGPISLPIRLQCLRAPMDWHITVYEGGIMPGLVCFTPKKNKQEQPGPYNPWEKRNELFRLQENDNEGACRLLNTVGFFEEPNKALRNLAALSAFDEAIRQRGKNITRAGLLRRLKRFVDQQIRAERQYDLVCGEDGWHHVLPESHVDVQARFFWEFRRKMLEEMKPKPSDVFLQKDYSARFAGLVRLGPSTVITALTFKDAIAATIRIDQLQKAKFQRCERPDCGDSGIPFAAVGNRKRKFCSWYCGHVMSVREARKREARKRKARKK